MMTQRLDLAVALRAYRQADDDGVMVLVSRQACDEAAAEIERGAGDADEAEQRRVQMAGILVAAEGGTRGDAVARKGEYGWSMPYQAVLELRLKHDALTSGNPVIVDDCNGLYATASEAYNAGIRSGHNDALRAAISRLSWISVKHEKAQDPTAFHTAEECVGAIVKLQDEIGEGHPAYPPKSEPQPTPHPHTSPAQRRQ